MCIQAYLISIYPALMLVSSFGSVIGGFAVFALLLEPKLHNQKYLLKFLIPIWIICVLVGIFYPAGQDIYKIFGTCVK